MAPEKAPEMAPEMAPEKALEMAQGRVPGSERSGCGKPIESQC